MLQPMPRTPQRSPPQVLTLEEIGAEGLPLRVLRVPGQGLIASPAPMVSTFFMVFVLTAGRGRGRHLEQVELLAEDIHTVPPSVEHQPLDVRALEGWIVGFDPTLLGASERLPRGPRRRGDAKEVPVRSLFLRGLLRLRPGEARRQRIERVVAEMEGELREARWGAESAALALFTLLATELVREMQEHAPNRCAVGPCLDGSVGTGSLPAGDRRRGPGWGWAHDPGDGWTHEGGEKRQILDP
ncbi:putative AraC/XylS-type transcriptional regulator [Chondromyces apiculatus DSM 436]|uniref:Putative AraC/XylS-type transcriptional regulator n=2 Tax=Chondromyces apiculatus TaxID=51 RepID=A0A017THH1_9BACT|nr:putative AraC/XylS-type transcriptional regulator [Chondromyces apiculatus DSM 436]